MSTFDGKTILITGGTGSFGGYFVDYLLDKNFHEIRVFSRDEMKQEEMRQRLQDPRIKFYIGDVRDRNSVDNAMGGVDYVFHAAALKQVPSCEFFPMQATQTNVMGSQNVIDSAISHKVSKVVSLSTDKAVYPINALGITKALMEKIVQATSRRLSDGGASYAHAQDVLQWNEVMSYSAWFLGLAQIPFFINFIWTIMKKRQSEPDRNPWQSTTIEWTAAPSPPIGHGNFDKDLTVYRGPCEYSVPGESKDYSPQTEK